CRATEHIKEMIELVKRIEKNGYTYTADGNVYFDTSKFGKYYELAGHAPEEEQTKARVEEDEAKKNKADFVLWFTRSKFANQEMQWDSPWGRGFPGWHLECSAMSIKYLGEQFDIHCGGIDHIPIHHTNEIAQSEAATAKHPWVKYWLHNEFLVMDKGKMAKSSGEFLRMRTITDKGYDPVVYRYFCLGAQYRQQLKFSWEGMDGAANTLKRLRDKTIELKENAKGKGKVAKKQHDDFAAALNDDLNTSQALAVMWAVLKDDSLADADKLETMLEFDKVLGLGMSGWEREKLKVTAEVQKLLDEREKARKAKDWKKADELRDKIAKAGFAVKDTPEGPQLDKI
ncbi:cysteine--tRNA ligase, partial [Candidatus Woesearchaeota archaeon]|nr:cysteine--tRNA ligase [Candidatus Woesearchaeota archaeon]